MSSTEEKKEPNVEKPFFDYDLDSLKISIEGIDFNINPDGHKPKFADKIITEVGKFEEYMKTNPSKKDEIVTQNETTKKILDTALIGYNHEDACKKLGYGILHKLSDFLFVYHVEHGGKEGFKLWLTQLNLAISTPSNGTKD